MLPGAGEDQGGSGRSWEGEAAALCRRRRQMTRRKAPSSRSFGQDNEATRGRHFGGLVGAEEDF